MAQLQLFGGPQDGLIKKLPSAQRPALLFVHSPSDDERINKVRPAAARKELKEQLSTLAYAFEKAVSKTGVGVEYQYHRSPDNDRT